MTLLPLAEVSAGLYLAACTVLAFVVPHTRASIPFLVLFAAGLLYIGLGTVLEMARSGPPPRPLAARPVQRRPVRQAATRPTSRAAPVSGGVSP